MNIPDMDYIILLISDSNKKSSNCMYEVLEVIRERKYFNKIFPGVIDSRICNPIMRAKHVKYWKKRVRELNAELTIIESVNLGVMSEILKGYQDIASNMVTFLDTVADVARNLNIKI